MQEMKHETYKINMNSKFDITKQMNRVSVVNYHQLRQ